MDPSTGTFISMDSYQGSLYDPVTLHKYLYANANPVTYTDPSGYFSLAELTTCTTASQILSSSWKFITFSTIMGALTGAVFGAVDSILGGNDFSKVVQDSLKGACSGAIFGCVISALACFSVLYPQLIIGLQIFQKATLILNGAGVIISLKDGNSAQAIFRGILGLFAYLGTGKLIADVKFANGYNVFGNDIDVETVDSNKGFFKGKSETDLGNVMGRHGYKTHAEISTRSRSGARKTVVENVASKEGRNIKQIQVSPGGGRHGELPYIKISTVNVGKIKIVFGSKEMYKPEGEKNVTVLFMED